MQILHSNVTQSYHVAKFSRQGAKTFESHKGRRLKAETLK